MTLTQTADRAAYTQELRKRSEPGERRPEWPDPGLSSRSAARIGSKGFRMSGISFARFRMNSHAESGQRVNQHLSIGGLLREFNLNAMLCHIGSIEQVLGSELINFSALTIRS